MKETKAAVRYAKSVLELARTGDKLDKVNKDMDLIAKTVSESRELEIMLNSPVINSDRKIAVLKAIFEGKVDELTMKFIILMTSKKREGILAEIGREFTDLYRKTKGITKAEVTTARPLDENIKSQIRARLNAPGEIEFVEKIDPSLIGGFIVKVGDKQFDGSISRSLLELRKNLLKNDYIPAF